MRDYNTPDLDFDGDSDLHDWILYQDLLDDEEDSDRNAYDDYNDSFDTYDDYGNDSFDEYNDDEDEFDIEDDEDFIPTVKHSSKTANGRSRTVSAAGSSTYYTKAIVNNTNKKEDVEDLAPYVVAFVLCIIFILISAFCDQDTVFPVVFSSLSFLSIISAPIIVKINEKHKEKEKSSSRKRMNPTRFKTMLLPIMKKRGTAPANALFFEQSRDLIQNALAVLEGIGQIAA